MYCLNYGIIYSSKNQKKSWEIIDRKIFLFKLKKNFFFTMCSFLLYNNANQQIIIHTSPPSLASLPSPHPIPPGHSYLQGRRCSCREWTCEHSRGGRVRQMGRVASKYTHRHTHRHRHTLSGVRWIAGEKLLCKQGAQTGTL